MEKGECHLTHALAVRPTVSFLWILPPLLTLHPYHGQTHLDNATTGKLKFTDIQEGLLEILQCIRPFPEPIFNPHITPEHWWHFHFHKEPEAK